MNSQDTALQLKSLISKYSKELLELYQHRTLPDIEHTDSDIILPQEVESKDVSAEMPIMKPPQAANRNQSDDCSPPPSMLRPLEPEQAEQSEDKMPRYMPRPSQVADDCSPSPSLLRPYLSDKLEMLSSMPPFDKQGYASIHIRVTAGLKSIPVSGAHVTVYYTESVNKYARKSEVTDSDGNTQPISIPVGSPPSSCTVEVSASGFCSARYADVPLYAGNNTTQQIDLIELPPGHKSDLLLLYDNPRTE